MKEKSYFCFMKITIELYCPHCQSTKIKKNGKKSYKKQNYLCKDCGRQFIGYHALTYKGCYSKLYEILSYSTRQTRYFCLPRIPCGVIHIIRLQRKDVISLKSKNSYPKLRLLNHFVICLSFPFNANLTFLLNSKNTFALDLK